MQTKQKINDLRQVLKAARTAGKSIALIPTMGNLHQGHLQLIREARNQYDFLVCSIFVNPLQFGANEDLDAYPRTVTADSEKLEAEYCDCLFLPSVTEIYGDGLELQTSIKVPGVTDNYCGTSRPGHFDGVAMVVTKLFNILQPDAAFFGLKDYQQFLVIQKLTRDLAFDIVVHGVETHREESGLAMSSRNNYLTDEQKRNAASLYKCLTECATEIQQGKLNFSELEATARTKLQESSLNPDYFNICDAESLRAATSCTRNFAILAAVQLAKSRLIDNVRFQLG